MARRSITDGEIALIKAMLERGMKNKDIQFLFNRPDRPVNSGRITGIRNGSYANSDSIARATDADLDTFLSAASRPGPVAAPAVGSPAADALAEASLRGMFEEGPDRRWRFTGGETDVHECKASFGLKYPSAWLRAIAALANNTGGYVLFGVHDKGAVVDGIDMSHVAAGMRSGEFEAIDPAEITKRVKSVFDPTPRVRTAVLRLGPASIGVLHVERHEGRPVIAIRNEGTDVREGEIYFRYPGQSARVKYSDLRAMLDARDRETRAQMMPMIERLLERGAEKSMIIDLTEGTLGDGRASIRIDEDLVGKLTFIKEGEFNQRSGAPTLRLVGDVTTEAGSKAVATRKGVITRNDVLDAFLDQSAPGDPESYIRFAVEVGQGEWLPLHYFASLAGLSREKLVDFINATGGTRARKRTYVQRVARDAAYKVAIGSPKAMLERMLSGETVDIADAQDASQFAQAVEALPHGQAFGTPAMLDSLRTCLRILEGKGAQSFVRRAICRVDELLFAKTDPN